MAFAIRKCPTCRWGFQPWCGHVCTRVGCSFRFDHYHRDTLDGEEIVRTGKKDW